MPHDEIIDKLIHVAKNLAEWMVGELGVVLPLGVTLDSTGNEPSTYFPRDQYREAGFEELLDLVADELAKRVAGGKVSACAVVCTLESEGREGFAIDIDSPSESVLLIYPYEKTESGVKVSEPQAAEGSLVGRFFGSE